MKMTLGRLVLFVVLAWVLVPVVLWQFGANVAERGQFGDMFGMVNALFSGLAFAGLYWALHLQREQLDMQRTELSLQREELKLQREEMKASRSELANQVQAQRALVTATAMQIAASAGQMNVEAMKLKIQHMGIIGGIGKTPRELIEAIEKQGLRTAELADRVQRLPGSGHDESA